MAVIDTFADPAVIPLYRNITIAAAGTVQELTVSKELKKLSFYPRTNPGKLLWNHGSVVSGLDDGEVIGANEYLTLPANVWTEVILRRDLGPSDATEVERIFLDTTVNGTVIEVIGEGFGSRVAG